MQSVFQNVYTENKLFFQIIGVFLVLFYIYYFSTQFSNVEITVKKDDILKATGRYNTNMIGTTDGRVFSVSTNPLIFRFNASELLNHFEPGKTYIVSGYGKRVPMLGLYPHITAVQKTN